LGSAAEGISSYHRDDRAVVSAAVQNAFHSGNTLKGSRMGYGFVMAGVRD